MSVLKRLVIVMVLAGVTISAGIWTWHQYIYNPWTRDGRIRAHVTMISPDVSGWIDALKVKNNQFVHKGDVLFTVDAARYRVALAKSQATLQQAQYNLDLAKDQYQRRQEISGIGAVSDEDLSNKKMAMLLAKADYDLARADVDAAELDLERTVIKAPVDGIISNMEIRAGDYLTRGQSVFSLVEANSFYVTGYFEETKLPHIHVGQKAKIYLMGHEDVLEGVVTGVDRGIGNANINSDKQLLPQIQQTFNWIRLAQRVPVNIQILNLPEDLLLVSGISASITLENADE